MTHQTVITGLGAVSSLGVSVEALVEGVSSGCVGWGHRSEWQYLGMGTLPFAGLPEFDRKILLPFLKPPYPLRYTQIALLAAEEAMALRNRSHDLPAHFGSLFATEFGPNEAVERHLTTLLDEGPESVRPLTFSATVMNAALGELARRWQLRGPSSVVLGSHPAIYAFDLLEDGEVDAILCGGAEEIRGVHVWAFERAGAVIAHRSGDLTEAPNAAIQRDSLVMGEGAAMVVLERADAAAQYGHHIFARLLGYGAARDIGSGHFFTRRSQNAFETAMRDALDRTGVQASEVTHVVGGSNNHIGTRDSETAAIAAVFGSCKPAFIPIKDYVGETFGASATMSMVLAASLSSRSENAVIMANAIHGGGSTSCLLITHAGMR